MAVMFLKFSLLQMLRLTKLNLGPGGDYDNSDTFISGDGGEPMAGDHYGVAYFRVAFFHGFSNTRFSPHFHR